MVYVMEHYIKTFILEFQYNMNDIMNPKNSRTLFVFLRELHPSLTC